MDIWEAIKIRYSVRSYADRKIEGEVLEALYEVRTSVPEWFINGLKSAQVAPTVMNQQKFSFSPKGN